ncbi:hypothetical protein NA57DRAFT_79179 [Rhizodiscina lignyota]|uniref:Uncharacterized protein n=1 Tax=Rhizodiscina lignyota TaxID=1504668 RepID=A0A9P4M389_9PEZI|nr:hypothetical protein NA57DRAFT_79179 [Rhizodiscina lignyota]
MEKPSPSQLSTPRPLSIPRPIPTVLLIIAQFAVLMFLIFWCDFPVRCEVGPVWAFYLFLSLLTTGVYIIPASIAARFHANMPTRDLITPFVFTVVLDVGQLISALDFVRPLEGAGAQPHEPLTSTEIWVNVSGTILQSVFAVSTSYVISLHYISKYNAVNEPLTMDDFIDAFIMPPGISSRTTKRKDKIFDKLPANADV